MRRYSGPIQIAVAFAVGYKASEVLAVMNEFIATTHVECGIDMKRHIKEQYRKNTGGYQTGWSNAKRRESMRLESMGCAVYG